jgi:hypothetical protein
MPRMKTSSLLRISIAICLLALVVTAAYLLGTTRANTAAALPSEITLGGALSAGTTSPAVPTSAPVAGDDAMTGGATTGSSAPTTTSPVVTTATTSGGPTPGTGMMGGSGMMGAPATSGAASPGASSPAGSGVQRSVMTTVWDWNCSSGGGQ